MFASNDKVGRHELMPVTLLLTKHNRLTRLMQVEQAENFLPCPLQPRTRAMTMTCLSSVVAQAASVQHAYLHSWVCCYALHPSVYGQYDCNKCVFQLLMPLPSLLAQHQLSNHSVFSYHLYYIHTGMYLHLLMRWPTGAKVGLCELPLDWIASDEKGGLGGTCILRGCVPKKLLHYASEFTEELRIGASYGYVSDMCTQQANAVDSSQIVRLLVAIFGPHPQCRLRQSPRVQAHMLKGCPMLLFHIDIQAAGL